MPINDISLALGMSSTLLSLKDIGARALNAQQRLASGKKVTTALDNPTNYFAATAARNRALDLDARKDGIGEAIRTVQAANAGIGSIGQMLQSANGLANAALASNDQGARDSYAKSFNSILTAIDTLASDSGYAGTNLINGNSSLSVNLSEKTGGSSLTIAGTSLDSTSLGIDKITIPPLSPFFGNPPDPLIDWKNVQSQVTLGFQTGGTTLGNMVPGSVQLIDASNGNRSVQPYAQYQDTTTGDVSFFFTTPPVNQTYYATWNVSLNENAFDAAGLATPVQQVLVGGTPAHAADYSSYYAGNNTSRITFAAGKEPAPGAPVEAVAGFQANSIDTISKVLVNGHDAAGTYSTFQGTYNGVTRTSVFFHSAVPTPSDSVTLLGSTLQSPLVTVADGTTAMVYGAGSGSFPRAVTSGAAAQTPPLVVWPTYQIKRSMSQIGDAVSKTRSSAADLSSDATVLTVRNDFIDSMSNILNTGADNLTLADMNEEGANMLMLNTQRDLAVQGLHMANQQAQAVLKMFG